MVRRLRRIRLSLGVGLATVFLFAWFGTAASPSSLLGWPGVLWGVIGALCLLLGMAWYAALDPDAYVQKLRTSEYTVRLLSQDEYESMQPRGWSIAEIRPSGVDPGADSGAT
jgi:hypothetical protein